jgi:hypothetical protein
MGGLPRGADPFAGGPEFAGIERIDWSAPWFAAFAERGARWQRLALAEPAGFIAAIEREASALAYRTGHGAPLAFVEQAALPAGAAYEAFIAETGCVPTRRNLHDFFNALVWFAFGRIKAVLNARQARAIGRDGIGTSRGAERDALTLFDENAVLFVTADAALGAALVAFDWQRLFVTEREAWGARCEVQPFGHALLEKLIDPYKACTAHAWIIDAPAAYFAWPDRARRAWLDEKVAASLAEGPLDSRMFAPLPVLGVPGWWPANGDPRFYDDKHVFRAGRRAGERPDPC